MRKPLFLDRDGVLNADVNPYVPTLAEFKVFPWTAEALTLLDRSGHDSYVISNQQGVGLGMTPSEELEKMSEALQALLRPEGFQIKKFYYATALDEENHPWRKPLPGMIHAAREEFGLDLDGAFLIGDKWSDIEAGARAGLRPLLVLSGVTHAEDDWSKWSHRPEAVFQTLLEAVTWVVAQGSCPLP